MCFWRSYRDGQVKGISRFFLYLIVFTGGALFELRAEPALMSLFPLGGPPGAQFTVEVRGKNLQGVTGAWFDCDGLKGQVDQIEPVVPSSQEEERATSDESSTSLEYVLTLRIRTSAELISGGHWLRLISDQGISNPLLLQVSPEPQILEEAEAQGASLPVQEIDLPAAVNGRIEAAGEVDFYAFFVDEGEEWLFEMRPAGPGIFDPVLKLYETSGSWFDADRLVRLAIDDEPNIYSWGAPRLTYRFNRGGRFVAAVKAFAGVVASHGSYQLRIIRTSDSRAEDAHLPFLAHPSEVWKERDFLRKLDAERPSAVAARTVQAEAEGKTAVFMEIEPNDNPSKALPISLPALIDGAIGHPGDIDYYRFEVEAGAGIALEVETPEQVPFHFMPYLVMLDDQGSEVVKNVYRKKVSPETWLNLLEPKTIYTFTEGGEYFLRVSDLTSRNGASDFRYRIMVRPQIPHVGEIKLAALKGYPSLDHVNLHVGQTRRVTVTVEQEENFDGLVTIACENLPAGVQVMPAAEVEPDKTGEEYDTPDRRYVPKSKTVTLLFAAALEAPAGPPRPVRVLARPVVGGVLGSALQVGEILFTVVRPQEETSEELARK